MKSMLAFVAALILSASSPSSAQSTVQLAPGRGEVAANAVPGLGTYSYDGSGNITAIGTQSFTYDAFGRLSTATVVPGRTQSFTYDRHGNLKEIKTTVGAVETKQPFGVDPATNQIDSPTGAANEITAAYDAAGNVTHYDGGVYVYDSLNLLKTSSIGGIDRAYLYTASDERIAVVGINGGIERGADWTIRDPAGRVLRRFSKNPVDGAWRWSEDYIWRGSQLLAAEVPEQEKVRHFHLDHLGTPRIVTGNGGSQLATYEYDPFGLQIATPTASSGILENPERLQFTAHERDTAKLDYMHARYYAPGAGRFLSVDPLLDIQTALREPQQWNRYSYVVNNPLKYTDPDGKDKFMAWLLGDAFRDVSTWTALKGALSPGGMMAAINEGRQEWAEDHRAATHGLSAVPTSRTEVGMQMVMMGPVGKFVGTSFGKLGTVIESQAGKITGFTRHGMNQVINRGVSPAMLKSITSNPTVVLAQSGGNKLFLTSEGAVVLNKSGQVVTAYTKKEFQQKILDVLDAAGRAMAQ